MTSYGTALNDHMDNEWINPPKPFNSRFDPKASDRYQAVTDSLEADGFYANHTRQECADEWQRRYDAAKTAGR